VDVLQGVMFFLVGLMALAGAIGVVFLRNPFFSVLSLVAHMLALAALFLLLHAQFLAAAQVIIYATAVMVLYVFVAAYVGNVEESLAPNTPALSLGPLFAGALFVELTIAALGSGLTALGTEGATIGEGFGGPQQIGQLLLKKFLIPFEAASFLLLLAAVGAVVLARKRRGLEDVPRGEAFIAPGAES
jgi:NADH-quinone oxidoreductase subunit J